ncbi:hypothetical protein SAMN05892883_2251 [Jatrophihabitans sp. GAS493]|uniref:hypothetical protein n=1 Tax=Jatrophihabitans sp. GAS493 TaxID=1907575 RepID=UPI000BB9B10E|nr:hypothetical protein [Jatrophihabitans sp. GAS493]SOD72939.1 hypothetical protein SAMN05892883_2251 [Jatrophihabitans sp. GAS493]
MFIAAQLGETWPELAARLDARDTLTRWAERERALLVVGSVAGLPEVVGAGKDPAGRDAVFGSLLRLAAQDSGDDTDAVLVILHLVDVAADRLRRRFDAGLILGSLTIQIRAFPWRTRTRAYASNLLFDTEKALCTEARPRGTRSSRGASSVRRDEDRLVDPTARDEGTGLSALDQPIDGPDSDSLDLVDLLLWAERTGVVNERDLAMLVEYYYAHETTRQGAGGGHEHVARVYGVSVRTSKGRCSATLRALREAAPQYLAA